MTSSGGGPTFGSDQISPGLYAYRAVKGGAEHALKVYLDDEDRRCAVLNSDAVEVDDDKMIFARKIGISDFLRIKRRAKLADANSPEGNPYLAADPSSDPPPF